MIKLVKTIKPAILDINGVNWTNQLLAKIAAGQKPTETEKTRYRHTEIKDALVQETHGKCAYCESKLKHIHHGDVEHIYPKSLDPALTFEWANLTYACEICNQNKSNNDPNLLHIIDPYVIDPSEHLTFQGALLFSLGTAYGTSTKALLDLNRTALCERRRETLEKVMSLFEIILNTSLPLITRQVLFDDLLVKEGTESSAYSAMTKTIIKVMSEQLPPEIVRTVGV